MFLPLVSSANPSGAVGGQPIYSGLNWRRDLGARRLGQLEIALALASILAGAAVLAAAVALALAGIGANALALGMIGEATPTGGATVAISAATAVAMAAPDLQADF